MPGKPLPDFTEAWSELALEIGFLVIEWNNLQEHLLLIFQHCLTGSAPDDDRAQAVWHSIQSDRTQREALRAVLKVWTNKTKFSDEAQIELDWLIVEANKLADMRNSVIHAPFIPFVSSTTSSLVPNHMLGNPKAKKLKAAQDLLKEIIWYREKAKTLSDYAIDLFVHLASSKTPLPGRPQLPHRGQSPTHN
jgi:hypothetical protein